MLSVVMYIVHKIYSVFLVKMTLYIVCFGVRQYKGISGRAGRRKNVFGVSWSKAVRVTLMNWAQDWYVPSFILHLCKIMMLVYSYITLLIELSQNSKHYIMKLNIYIVGCNPYNYAFISLELLQYQAQFFCTYMNMVWLPFKYNCQN